MRTLRTLSLSLATMTTMFLTLPVAGAWEFDNETVYETAPAPQKAPPLPFLTIEGVGGGSITPMAYLVNPGKDGEVFGKPAFAMSYVNANRKSLNSLAVSETLFKRIEFGYAAERLELGCLPSAIQEATSCDIDTNSVWLHNFNLRYLAIEENDTLAGIALPAVTFGASFKYNNNIASINNILGGALSGIGYHRNSSVDYTLTATKTFATLGFGRPVIVSSGLRLSEAANLGFLGFGDKYRATFEGNIAYLPKDWLVLAYEFRQKTTPYGQIPGLIGGEDNWHALDVGLILNRHTTLATGWASLGTLANTKENGAWFFQLKHEF